MQHYKFLQSALEIHTYLFLLSTTFLLYIIFKGYRYTSILSKMVYRLGKGITDEKVEDFIAYLDTKYIPFYATNLVKSAYRLVDMDESIEVDLKLRLKIMALSKGILVE